MSVIGTNSMALRAQRAIETASKATAQATERLSSGKRINGARDDAAGLAIATSMTSQLKGLEMGVRNAQDGISPVQSAEGLLGEVETSLQRLRELALQAANDVNTADQRTAMQVEFEATLSHVDTLLEQGMFNDILLFSDTSNGIAATDYNRDGDLLDQNVYNCSWDEPDHQAGANRVTIQTGPDASDTVTLDLPTLRSNTDDFTLLGTDMNVAGTMRFVGIGNIDLTLEQDVGVGATCGHDSGGTYGWGDSVGYVRYTGSDYKSYKAIGVTASHGLSVIDAAIEQISAARVALGAGQQRLESVAAQAQTEIVNLTEARSRIEDADFSAETTALATSQILSQAATAMLAQANASQRDVLKLIE
ncbi:MAG: flagellin [Pseudomonadota bacterium]